MVRSRSVLVAGVVLALTALAGCGGGTPGGGGADDGPVELVFRQFDPPAEAEGLQRAIDTWNTANPDIQVKLETLSGADSMQQFAREANSGSGPDVVQIGFVNVKDLAMPRILTPVDELMESAALEVPLTDHLALDMTQFEGKTWALPWTVDTFALAYNPDVLAAAGVDAPPTSWEELRTVSEAIAKATPGTSGFCFPGASGPASGQWFALNYNLWASGGNLITDQGGTWVPGADAQQFATAIDFFNGFFTSGATARSFIATESINDPQLVQGVANGTCAMAMMAPQTFRQARESNPELKTAMMPAGDVDGATHLGGRALGVNASSDHPEQAWKFVSWLTGAEAFETIQQFPAASTVLEQMEVGDGEEGYQQQLPHSRSFARYISGPVPIPTLQKIVNAEYGSVYSGQKTSAQAGEAIVTQLQTALQK